MDREKRTKSWSVCSLVTPVSALCATPMPDTPENYAAEIDREETRWGEVVRKLNLKVE